MKTEIELYDIQPTKGGYVAEYNDGEDKTPFISTENLIEYIISSELNSFDMQDEDGVIEQVWLDPSTYLEENYFEVVKTYLNI